MMPYNYILSNQLRKNMGISLEGAIVIIDEAHNISQAAEQALSFEINTVALRRITHELTYLLKLYDFEMYKTVRSKSEYHHIMGEVNQDLSNAAPDQQE